MKTAKFSIRFPTPEAETATQSEEYCIIEQEGQTRRIRLHDYQEIYAVPGLYEAIFCERLRYRSPEVVTRSLIEEGNKSRLPLSELVVLNTGAGNGRERHPGYQGQTPVLSQDRRGWEVPLLRSGHWQKERFCSLIHA
jgi:hypothetical protein